jgi:hypothetical protein
MYKDNNFEMQYVLSFVQLIYKNTKYNKMLNCNFQIVCCNLRMRVVSIVCLSLMGNSAK